jgi:predicted lactoylglutathione lyase
MATPQTKIFINLPVKDLAKTQEFFTKLGFTFNPQFTDEKAASLVISDTIFAMLLREEFFKTITTKPIADARKTTEAIVALAFESRAKVDQLMEKALAAGGTEAREKQDEGWMYGRSLYDLDGHLWEFVHMDEAAVPQSAR